MFVSGNCNVYGTAPTFDLSKLLIQDMIKIEKNAHSFGVPEIDNMMQKAKTIGFKEKIIRGNASFELRSSGHVIGGSTVAVITKDPTIKPVFTSYDYKKLRRRFKDPDLVQFCNYNPFLGIIPIEISDVFPASHYVMSRKEFEPFAADSRPENDTSFPFTAYGKSM